jgi:hypothetical protein
MNAFLSRILARHSGALPHLRPHLRAPQAKPMGELVEVEAPDLVPPASPQQDRISVDAKAPALRESPPQAAPVSPRMPRPSAQRADVQTTDSIAERAGAAEPASAEGTFAEATPASPRAVSARGASTAPSPVSPHAEPLSQQRSLARTLEDPSAIEVERKPAPQAAREAIPDVSRTLPSLAAQDPEERREPSARAMDAPGGEAFLREETALEDADSGVATERIEIRERTVERQPLPPQRESERRAPAGRKAAPANGKTSAAPSSKVDEGRAAEPRVIPTAPPASTPARPLRADSKNDGKHDSKSGGQDNDARNENKNDAHELEERPAPLFAAPPRPLLPLLRTGGDKRATDAAPDASPRRAALRSSEKLHARSEQAAPEVVRVHIGRVEIRQSQPQIETSTKRPQPAATANTTLSLKDYLKEHSSSGRREP